MSKFKLRQQDPYLAAARKRIASTPAKGNEASYFLRIVEDEAPVTPDDTRVTNIREEVNEVM